MQVTVTPAGADPAEESARHPMIPGTGAQWPAAPMRAAAAADSNPADLGIDGILGAATAAADSAGADSAGMGGAGMGGAGSDEDDFWGPDPDEPMVGTIIPPSDPVITPAGSGFPGSGFPGSGLPGGGPEPAGAPAPASFVIEEPAAGRPRWQRLQLFAMDSRMRIWRRRLLIAVAAGVVFSLIFTWRLGLTVAVLVAIADTVYRSRTMASIPPGIRLTRAQRRTQRQLAHMERAGYRALHSRRIPSSDQYIDHLVVGPAGVFAIDSEAWDRRLPIRTRNARQLWHGPKSKKERLEHAQWEASQASDLLSAAVGTHVSVRPAMAVYGPKIPWDIATIRDVDVFRGSRLRKYLRKRVKLSGMPPLTDDEVDKIHRAAMVALPLAGNEEPATPVG
jgi:hypothetical protein